MESGGRGLGEAQDGHAGGCSAGDTVHLQVLQDVCSHPLVHRLLLRRLLFFRRRRGRLIGWPLIHGRMIYRCEQCGKNWPMYLEKGIEEFGENHKPSPFTIACPYCGTARTVDRLARGSPRSSLWLSRRPCALSELPTVPPTALARFHPPLPS